MQAPLPFSMTRCGLKLKLVFSELGLKWFSTVGTEVSIWRGQDLFGRKVLETMRTGTKGAVVGHALEEGNCNKKSCGNQHQCSTIFILGHKTKDKSGGNTYRG